MPDIIVAIWLIRPGCIPLVIINHWDDSPGQDLFAVNFLEFRKRWVRYGRIAGDCRLPRKLRIGQFLLRGISGPPGRDFCGCVHAKFRNGLQTSTDR